MIRFSFLFFAFFAFGVSQVFTYPGDDIGKDFDTLVKTSTASGRRVSRFDELLEAAKKSVKGQQSHNLKRRNSSMSDYYSTFSPESTASTSGPTSPTARGEAQVPNLKHSVPPLGMDTEIELPLPLDELTAPPSPSRKLLVPLRELDINADMDDQVIPPSSKKSAYLLVPETIINSQTTPQSMKLTDISTPSAKKMATNYYHDQIDFQDTWYKNSEVFMSPPHGHMMF